MTRTEFEQTVNTILNPFNIMCKVQMSTSCDVHDSSPKKYRLVTYIVIGNIGDSTGERFTMEWENQMATIPQTITFAKNKMIHLKTC